MSDNLIKRFSKVIIILLPSIVAMYGLYWMETNEVWTIQNKLRDLLTIVLMGTGLVTSFLLFTKLTRK